MTYPEAIRYLESFTDYEKNTNYSYREALKLKRIKDFLSVIGNPQKSLRVIHVAGTKGKGSTCAFTAYILREAGFSTGLYTSPHLNDFRERIRILRPIYSLYCPPNYVIANALSGSGGLNFRYRDNSLAMTRGMVRDFEGMISQKELSCLVGELKPVIDRYNRQSKYGALSFFEVYTAIAFLYFKREDVDFAVLETGMGGALDATNAADSLACGITPVSFEHVQKLGSTLKKIAGEKAGIIKNKGAAVISALQDKESAKAIHDRCERFQAKYYEIGKQIRYFNPDFALGFEENGLNPCSDKACEQKNRRRIQCNTPRTLLRAERSQGKDLETFYQNPNANSGFKGKQSFTIKGLRKVYKNLRIRLLGVHQIANASLAVGLVEALGFYGFDIGELAIRKGLYNTIWPGRCEVIKKNPLVVLDGAQNLASAAALKSAIRDNFKYKNLILVLGISEDKDISGVCGTLNPLADTVILTRASTSRAIDPLKLSGYFRSKVYLTQSVKEAKLLAERIARPEDLILVTGSLFVAGEFRNVQR